jgi:hypothetical protein
MSCFALPYHVVSHVMMNPPKTCVSCQVCFLGYTSEHGAVCRQTCTRSYLNILLLCFSKTNISNEFKRLTDARYKSLYSRTVFIKEKNA